MSAIEESLKGAIAERRLISFEYGGCRRLAEPHVLGLKDGALELLVFQIGGDSRSGRLPNWRRCFVAEMTSLQVREDGFPGPRALPQAYRVAFDRVLAVVRGVSLVRP